MSDNAYDEMRSYGSNLTVQSMRFVSQTRMIYLKKYVFGVVSNRDFS